MFFNDTDLYKVDSFQKYHIGSSFTSLGVPSAPIIFQIPAVENPDPDVDSDWVQMTYDDKAFQLDAGNLSLTISGAQDKVRVKRASTADNCSWKW